MPAGGARNIKSDQERTTGEYGRQFSVNLSWEEQVRIQGWIDTEVPGLAWRTAIRTLILRGLNPLRDTE